MRIWYTQTLTWWVIPVVLPHSWIFIKEEGAFWIKLGSIFQQKLLLKDDWKHWLRIFVTCYCAIYYVKQFLGQYYGEQHRSNSIQLILWVFWNSTGLRFNFVFLSENYEWRKVYFDKYYINQIIQLNISHFSISMRAQILKMSCRLLLDTEAEHIFTSQSRNTMTSLGIWLDGCH